jgi:predicted nucleotidyltransferase
MNKSAQIAQKTKFRRPPVVRKKATAPKHTAPPFTDKIPFIRSLILDSVKPGVIKKIYLFGSYAYGKPTKNSDVDLCVVINNRFDDNKAYMKIALNLYDNGIIPADTLVYKENQFYNIKNPNGIKNTIMTQGKLIYG